MKYIAHALILSTLVWLIGCTSASDEQSTATVNTLVPATAEPSVMPQAAETEPVSPSILEAQNLFQSDEMGITIGFDYPEDFIQNISTAYNNAYEPIAPHDLPYPQNFQVLFPGYAGGEGYVLNSIRVFRVDEINALELGVVENINAVLEEQTDHHTDFPRLAGAGSVIDAQLIILPFENGSGFRYLISKSFSADPLANTSMTYMYQGITEDDKFFISLVMSVDAPFLSSYVGQPLTTPEEFETYFQTINSLVETASGDQFNPSLHMLDSLISSLIVMEK